MPSATGRLAKTSAHFMFLAIWPLLAGPGPINRADDTSFRFGMPPMLNGGTCSGATGRTGTPPNRVAPVVRYRVDYSAVAQNARCGALTASR